MDGKAMVHLQYSIESLTSDPRMIDFDLNMKQKETTMKVSIGCDFGKYKQQQGTWECLWI